MVMRLVGRQPELRRLLAAVRDETPGVLLEGPAGIGKTHLLRALTGRLQARTTPVRWARAGATAAAVPLAPFHDLLDGAGERGAVAAAARAELADDGPGVLVVDDVHRLDDASAEVVAALVAAPDVTVIGARRTEEPVPAPVDAAIEPLHRLPLAPLVDDEVRDLTEAVTGAPLVDRAAAEILRLADGNPLFASELAADALARGCLREDDAGVLRLVEPLEAPMELTALLAQRVERLAPEQRRALELVALADPLPLAVAGRLAPRAELQELVAGGLLEQDLAGGRIWPWHPLAAEVLLAALPPGRRVERCRELVAATADHPDVDPVRRARWQLTAGTDEAAAPVLLAGARAAAARFDLVGAEELAREAVTVGVGPEAHLVLGEALAGQPGRGEEAEEELARLEDAADEELLARSTGARARNLLFGLGRPDLAAELARRIDDRVTAPRWRTELRAVQGLSAMLLGDVVTAASAGDGIARDDDVDPRALVTVRVVSTLGRVMLGRLAGTGELIDEARALLAETPHVDHLPLAEVQLALNATYRDAYSGRLEEADDRAGERLDAAVAAGQDALVGLWAAMHSHVVLLRGDVRAADRLAAEADPLLAEQDVLRVRVHALCQRGAAAALLGHREQLGHALARLAEVEPRPAPRMAVNIARLEAWALALDGDLDGAVARLVDAGELGDEAGHPVWAALTRYEAVRLGRAEAVVDGLERAATVVDPGLVDHLAAHARAAVDGDAPALRAVGAALSVAGAHLHAAEALHDAADVQEAAGDAAGVAALRTAAAWALPAGARGTWTVDGRGGPPALSARELEVAGLAATGRSSRAIAERLVLSRRTVDNHLATVYRALGLGGRGDLRELLGDVAPGPDAD